MLKIRLTRTGKTGQASYRVVVAESANAQQGKVVEILGWYNPTLEGKDRFSIDMAKYQEWVEKGAQPNDSVLRLVLSKKEKEAKWPAVKGAKEETKAEAVVEQPKATEEASTDAETPNA